jgi:eukaryotic-like serine/threonine-protein kinase
VTTVIENPVPAADPRFVFGAYTLDPRSRRLLRGNDVVPLTMKAFDTLEVLVRSAGHTVTKDALLKRVWPDTFVQEDTLAQNISTIRKALGDSTESPRYVVTVPREGYRFVAAVEVAHPADQPLGGLDVTHPPVPARLRRRSLTYALAGAGTAVILAVIAFVMWNVMTMPAVRGIVPPEMKFEVYAPEGNQLSTSGGGLALSPDGRHLAFLASADDGRDFLWIRDSASLQSRRLERTAGASQPFWSPDGQSIAFFSEGWLRRVDISGDQPRPICQLPGPNALAGTWNRDELILFAVGGKGLFQVSAAGGTPAPIPLAGWGSCTYCLWPSFLPDGRRFLFTVVAGQDRGIYLASAASAPKRLLEESSSAAFVNGYIVYSSAGALMGRPFDPAREQVGSEDVPFADRVAYNPGTHRAMFSASETGVIAYAEPIVSRLQWISRAGTTLSTAGEAVYHSFAVSRGGRILAEQLDPRVGTYDLWRYDPGASGATRVTSDVASDLHPMWLGDDDRAVFTRETTAGWQLYLLKVDTPGDERPLLPQPSAERVDPVAWVDDALVYVISGQGSVRFWSIRVDTPGSPTPIREGRPAEGDLRLTSDGDWLAYTTNEPYARVPGRTLVVRPWRGGSLRSEIATAASVPRWRDDGGELFFMAPGGKLMAQRIDQGRPIASPAELCRTLALAASGVTGESYDAASDGEKFLVKVPARPPAIIVMSHWPR